MTSVQQAYALFSTERFTIPTMERVEELERDVRVTLPAEYREFIPTFNGGYFSEPRIRIDGLPLDFDALSFMHGVGASHAIAELGRRDDLSLWDGNDPPIFIPIGYTVRGNFIIIFVAQDGDDYGTIAYKTPREVFPAGDNIHEFFGRLE